MKKLTRQLEQILTIDGKGRPAKAKMLLEILEDPKLKQVLVEISKRKFF